MSVSKKALKLNRYKLGGAMKKNGINVWRFVFNGVENATGIERTFFIEFLMLNPFLSASKVLLGFKPCVNISAEDLQNVLAGTASTESMQTESIIVPSYTAVRVGVLGGKAKQLCEYHPVKSIKVAPYIFDIEAGNCSFSEHNLSGLIELDSDEIQKHPEYFCDAGLIRWDLKYETVCAFASGFSGKEMSWYATGAYTVFAGSISIDGKDYTVLPKSSFGYLDRNWGRVLPSDWFHLSASHLTSLITGQLLQNSCFAAQGVYDGRLSLVMRLGGTEILFSAEAPKRAYSSTWNCVQMPEDQEGEKLHWSATFNSHQFVIDIDVFCPAHLLFVRNIEYPEGGRKLMKLIAGGDGTGEIRLYKCLRKDLELIEHARIGKALCEFGQPDDSGA